LDESLWTSPFSLYAGPVLRIRTTVLASTCMCLSFREGLPVILLSISGVRIELTWDLIKLSLFPSRSFDFWFVSILPSAPQLLSTLYISTPPVYSGVNLCRHIIFPACLYSQAPWRVGPLEQVSMPRSRASVSVQKYRIVYCLTRTAWISCRQPGTVGLQSQPVIDAPSPYASA
jgi:hypothetical protein